VEFVMSAMNTAVGLLVASAAIWVSSGEAAPCKKAAPFCHHTKGALAKPVVSKSPSPHERGIVRVDDPMQGGEPKPAQPPVNHGPAGESIDAQFRGG
jgi:hypothetical protein